MIKQYQIFETNPYELGSKKWRKNKYLELVNKTLDELEDIFNYCLDNIKNDEDYYTSLVIIDINHYDKIKEFKKKYPKSQVYKQKPIYL